MPMNSNYQGTLHGSNLGSQISGAVQANAEEFMGKMNHQMGWFFLQELYDECVSSMRSMVPYDTGLLRSSIGITPITQRDNNKRREIYIREIPYESRGGEYDRTTLDSAKFQEYGYTPHYINPLRFADSSRYYCEHAPGKSLYVSKNTPFIEPALAKTYQNTERIVSKIDEVFDNLTNKEKKTEEFGFKPFITYDESTGKYKQTFPRTDWLTKYMWMKWGVTQWADVPGVILSRKLWYANQAGTPGFAESAVEDRLDKVYIKILKAGCGRPLGYRQSAEDKIAYQKKREDDFYQTGRKRY